MVNVSRFMRWIYNLFFNADKKRQNLKDKAHYAVSQNSHEYSDKVKADLVRYEKEMDEYTKLRTKIDKEFFNYQLQKVTQHIS